MSQPRSSRIGRQGRSGAGTSKRERAEIHRSERARAHLERVRGGKLRGRQLSTRVFRIRPKVSLVASVAAVVSLTVGAAFGSPIVVAARSWIAGEPMRLESFSVSGAKRLSLSEVAAATALPKGALVGEIESADVESNLRAHPWISEALVVRLPASRLLLRITEHIARAVVATNVGDPNAAREWRVVSASGLAFATASDLDVATLPELVSPSAASLGAPDEASDVLANAIDLTRRFAAFDLPIPVSIVVDDGKGFEGFIVRLPELAPRVILGREKLDERLASLAEVLQASPPELAEAESIDLRFAKQAVLRSALSLQGAAQAATTHGGVALPKPRPTG